MSGTPSPGVSAASAAPTGLSPDALPPSLRAAMAPATSPDAAEAFTRNLTLTHYENFPVVSVLLPSHLRQDFCNVYAFCRVADDLGDELGDRATSTAWLAELRHRTQQCFAGRSDSVLFAALSSTIRRHDLPADPFLDLIDAFEQDQRVSRYETFADVLDYCRRSANPVGRLVLFMCGYRDEQRHRLSDATCTALQLANFWQDVRRDLLERDRIYLPAESMARFGVTEDQIREGIGRNRAGDSFRRLIAFEVDRAAGLFAEGEALLPLLAPSVRRHISLFAQGGQAVLHAIRRQEYDTLARRPALSGWQKGRLVWAAVLAAAAAQLARPLAGRPVVGGQPSATG